MPIFINKNKKYRSGGDKNQKYSNWCWFPYMSFLNNQNHSFFILSHIPNSWNKNIQTNFFVIQILIVSNFIGIRIFSCVFNIFNKIINNFFNWIFNIFNKIIGFSDTFSLGRSTILMPIYLSSLVKIEQFLVIFSFFFYLYTWWL